MKLLRSLGLIINYKTFIVSALAALATFACRIFGLTANFPLTLVGVAIVFPIVFSIGGAYKRREDALKEYGSLKAHGRAIYFASRDWIDEPDTALRDELRDLLGELLQSCRDLFHSPVQKMDDKETRVYNVFSRLSQFIRRFRSMRLASNEVSRCNQYLSKMVIAFENIKHIYQYRTPRTLRTYSKLFIFLLPVLYGPYFAEISVEWGGAMPYVMPVLFSVVFVSLDNIQDHLENPFDLIGEDDIIINAEKFAAKLES